MAIKAIDYGHEDWYVSQDDPDKRETLAECQEAGATIFWFKAIPSVISTDIQDSQQVTTIRAVTDRENNTGMEQVLTQRTANRNRSCFRHAITKIDNLFTGNGVAVMLTRERTMIGGKVYEILSEETMNSIPSAYVNEVGAEIFMRNTMDEVKRKKYEGALLALDGSNNGTVATAPDKSDTSVDVPEMPASA